MSSNLKFSVLIPALPNATLILLIVVPNNIRHYIMFVANRSAAFRITVLKIYHTQRDNFPEYVYHISSATNVFLEMEQDILEPIFRTFKMKVEIICTTITCSTSYYEINFLQLWCHALGVSHVSVLYTSFSWRKSCL